MKSLFALLFLLALPLCVLSQITLVESGPGVVKPSDTLTLTCKSSSTLPGYWWSWIRQPPGKALEWLAAIGGGSEDTGYAPSLQSRLTISKDNSKNEFYLQMRGMKPDDSARYYCARVQLGWFDYWGQGTPVTVTTVLSAPPQVFPLLPCCKDIPADTVTVAFLVTSYFPEPVVVKWGDGSNTSNIKTFPAVLGSNNSIYTLSSEISIPVSEWNTKALSFNVEHAITNTSISKTIGPNTCPVCSEPDIRLLQESCPKQDSNSFVRLACLVSKLCSRDVELKWYQNSTPLPTPVKYHHTGDQGDHLLITTQDVSQHDWNRGATFTCQVKDLKNVTTQTTISKCSDGQDCLGISVFLLPPTPEDLLIRKKPKLMCLIANLPSSSGYSFNWNPQKVEGQMPQTEDPVKHSNGSYSVASFLDICIEDWQSYTIFTCAVNYTGLTAPIVKTISKNKGELRAPVVSVYPPSPEVLALEETVCLSCLTDNFWPSEIFVSWTQGDMQMDPLSYSTTPAQFQDISKAYYAYSKLCIPYSDWNKGESYSCVIAHEALPMDVTQKSLDKSSDFPTCAIMYRDLEVNENDEERDSLSVTAATFIVLFLLSLFYSTTLTLFKGHLGIQMKSHRTEDCPHSTHLLS